jgi:solute carrier family 25 phosphate transporter 23/24/25/41
MIPDLVIGGISGMVSRTLTAPLELWKLQRQNSFMPGSTLGAVIRDEGFRYLWKGNGTNCIRVFPQTAINYQVYTLCDEHMFKSLTDGRHRRLVSGAFGGAVSMAFTYPLETVRSRLSLQLNSTHYRGVVDAIRSIPCNDLFRGLGMSVLGYAPFSAISFSAYFTYKEYFDHHPHGTMNPDLVKILAGGGAGITAILVTYPSDLIRRRLQLQNFDKSVPKYTGIIDCFRKVVRLEGVTGLYRGLTATCVKLFPTIGIQFLVMEKLKTMNYTDTLTE